MKKKKKAKKNSKNLETTNEGDLEVEMVEDDRSVPEEEVVVVDKGEASTLGDEEVSKLLNDLNP